MSKRALFAAGLLCAVSLPASETTTFTYDSRGRLIQVARAGQVNNGVTAIYAYDPADNRTQVTVTGAGSATPSFAIGDIAGSEGGVLSFTVTRSGDLSAAQSVTWASAGNSATSGVDFTATGGTLTFAAIESTKTVSVSTLQDAAVEGNETLFVNLTAPTGGATIGDAQGIGTINDDDVAAPTFAISDVSVAEGGTLVLTVTKTGSGSGSYTVNYASADGSALTPSDYTAASGILTFTSSDTTKTISIATIDDSAVESSETVLVNLTSPSGGATLSDAQGVGTITDNDVAPPPSPSLSVSDGSNLEAYPVTFTVTRGGDTSVSVSVSYATAPGTANSGDFTAKSGTLNFAAGETSKTVSVSTSHDTRVEGTEEFFLDLSNPTGATISDGQGVGSISDDDGEPCPNC